MKRAQAWSIDLIIGVLIFLLAGGVFYVLLTTNAQKDTTQLKIESETVAAKISSEQRNTNFEEILKKDYNTLKQEMGVNAEFCIFLEDQEGNVINITNITGTGEWTFIGIGPNTNDLILAGVPCGAGSMVS